MFDLHMHTVWSDGTNTAEEMVQEAIRKGLETVGISDHSSGDPCGMTLEQSADYRAEIARLKEKYAGQIRVLCGLERDYFTDDFADYDYTIGSVHWLAMPDGHRVPVDYMAEKLREGADRYFGGDFYALAEAAKRLPPASARTTCSAASSTRKRAAIRDCRSCGPSAKRRESHDPVSRD